MGWRYPLRNDSVREEKGGTDQNERTTDWDGLGERKIVLEFDSVL